MSTPFKEDRSSPIVGITMGDPAGIGPEITVKALLENDFRDLIVIGDYVIFTTLSENQILRAYNIKNGYGAWSIKLADEVTRMQAAMTSPPPAVPPTAAPAATVAPTTAQ